MGHSWQMLSRVRHALWLANAAIPPKSKRLSLGSYNNEPSWPHEPQAELCSDRETSPYRLSAAGRNPAHHLRNFLELASPRCQDEPNIDTDEADAEKRNVSDMDLRQNESNACLSPTCPSQSVLPLREDPIADVGRRLRLVRQEYGGQG